MGGRVALEVFRMAADAWNGWRCSIRASTRAKPVKRRRGRVDRLARREGMDALAARWLPPMLHPDHMALLGPLTEMVKRSTPETFENQQRALLDRPDARTVLSRFTARRWFCAVERTCGALLRSMRRSRP